MNRSLIGDTFYCKFIQNVLEPSKLICIFHFYLCVSIHVDIYSHFQSNFIICILSFRGPIRVFIHIFIQVHIVYIFFFRRLLKSINAFVCMSAAAVIYNFFLSIHILGRKSLRFSLIWFSLFIYTYIAEAYDKCLICSIPLMIP